MSCFVGRSAKGNCGVFYSMTDRIYQGRGNCPLLKARYLWLKSEKRREAKGAIASLPHPHSPATATENSPASL
ncbi:MAG TPA: hypothetical protein V6D12_19630 [Candidatus Obscuribacterales bacterium]